MATGTDPHIADTVIQALTAGGGQTESTTESQHVRAVAQLTSRVAQNSQEVTLLAAAIATINAQLAHIRDPRNH